MVVLITGIVYQLVGIVCGASIAILSAIVISIVLGCMGFFRWSACRLIEKAKQSGITLFWYVNLLCFPMTLFFTNDGSTSITTPMIIRIVRMLLMKRIKNFPTCWRVLWLLREPVHP